MLPGLALVGLQDKPGIAFKIFSLLARNNVNVDIILQSIGRSETKDISFTVAKADMELAQKLLEDNQRQHRLRPHRRVTTTLPRSPSWARA